MFACKNLRRHPTEERAKQVLALMVFRGSKLKLAPRYCKFCKGYHLKRKP